MILIGWVTRCIERLLVRYGLRLQGRTPLGKYVLKRQERLVDELDLRRVSQMLIKPGRGKTGVSEADARAYISEYRLFLKLALRYPGHNLMPLVCADEAWHNHILDTGNYREDCLKLFGEPLDHYPYLGQDSPKDVTEGERAAAETLRLYELEFGVEVANIVASCGSSECRNLRTLNRT